MQRYAIFFAAAALVATACGGDDTAESTTTAVPVTPTTASSVAEGGANQGAALVAQEGDFVEVHYVGTLDDGSEFDASRGREPLGFLVGSEQVIGGFDDAVRGMTVGDVVTVRISPEDAYGIVDQELIFTVPLEQAPDDVAVGDAVLIGGISEGVVIEVTDAEVTIDTNHRFAGQALTFEIEVMTISR
jgi:FKBP-type peptidyl-prolyl cis-trans isomerase 2